MDNFGGSCYKRLDDFAGPPPSYADAVPNPPPVETPQPSAPPLDILPPPSSYQRSSIPTEDYHEPTSTNNRRVSSQDSSPPAVKRLVSAYVCYSMARHLRKYITPKSEHLDPELDVEAQFSRRVVRDARSQIARKQRLQCISGWLWCFGVIQVLIYILLPPAMLITGGIGFSDCSYRSNAIIIYLLLGGSMVAVFICTRSIPSLLTCFRNRNYLNTRDSGKFTACICLFELTFYMVAICNLIILVLGSFWIFHGDTPICSQTITTDCCHRYVYAAGAFFNVFQYVLFTVTTLYSCLVVGCVRNMDSKHGSS